MITYVSYVLMSKNLFLCLDSAGLERHVEAFHGVR